jgi:hypothetical protein
LPRPWALPQGKAVEGKGVDVIVFIGIDPFDDVSVWAIPSVLVRPGTPCITVVAPRSRKRVVPSVLTGWDCQPTRLLRGIERAFTEQQRLVLHGAEFPDGGGGRLA